MAYVISNKLNIFIGAINKFIGDQMPAPISTVCPNQQTTAIYCLLSVAENESAHIWTSTQHSAFLNLKVDHSVTTG